MLIGAFWSFHGAELMFLGSLIVLVLLVIVLARLVRALATRRRNPGP